MQFMHTSRLFVVGYIYIYVVFRLDIPRNISRPAKFITLLQIPTIKWIAFSVSP
jgi:hypothetical protein